MDFSVIQVISWLLERLVKVEAARVVSNELTASDILIIAYLVLSIKIKKSCFIVAFFVMELLGYFAIPHDITDYYLFACYVSMYVVCYWIGVSARLPLKSLSACAIMIIFQMVMALDAFIFPETKTFMYLHYEYFFVLIHLYFISTLDKWSLSWSDMASRISNIFNSIRYNYNFTLLLL